MKLRIEQPYVDAMMDEFPELGSLAEQLRFGNRALVSIEQLDKRSLAFLQNLYENAGPGMQGRTAQIATLKNALNDEGSRYGPDELESLVAGIAEFLIDGSIRGWLFHANMAGRPMPFLVTRLDYTPPGEEEAGRIFIEIKANSQGKLAIKSITIRNRDLNNKTVSEIFAAKGYLKETPALIASYDEAVERYFDWRSHYGSQFSGRGSGIYAEDPTASHRRTDWSRKNVVVLSSSAAQARLVNDEGILNDRSLTLDAAGNFLDKYLRKAGKRMNHDDKVEASVEASRDRIQKGMFTELRVTIEFMDTNKAKLMGWSSWPT